MQIADALGQAGGDGADAIPAQVEGLESRPERKVGEGGNVIVSKVYGILILRAIDECLVEQKQYKEGRGRRTLMRPRFSKAGIL